MENIRALIIADSAWGSDLVGYLNLEGVHADLYVAGHGVVEVGPSFAYDVVISDKNILHDHVNRLIFDLCNVGVPVVILPKDQEALDRIIALELGVADCLPFSTSPRELLARVGALVRLVRTAKLSFPLASASQPSWKVDEVSRFVISPRGETIRLTGGEFSLLMILARAPRCCFDRETLARLTGDAVGGLNIRAVDIRISRLRAKLALGGGGRLIETVRGNGYRFVGELRSRWVGHRAGLADLALPSAEQASGGATFPRLGTAAAGG